MWCTGSDECCTTPYFLKTLPQPTTDDIEMRVCRNEGRDNEDIAIENCGDLCAIANTQDTV